MNEFKREERYVVFKLSRLDKNKFIRGKQLGCLGNSFIADARVDCLVVESDWPEYEPVWEMIKARVTGAPILDHTNCHADLARIGEEIDALRLELTKARELLSLSIHQWDCVRGPSLAEINGRIRYFLANQSAPAAKDEKS